MSNNLREMAARVRGRGRNRKFSLPFKCKQGAITVTCLSPDWYDKPAITGQREPFKAIWDRGRLSLWN